MGDYQKFLPFLQAWLFFGLLDTVLSDSIRDLDVYQEFTTGAGYLNTKSLPRHLKHWRRYEEIQWEDCENIHECKKVYRVRMMRTQMALDRAKGVVRRYCSLDGTPPTGYEYTLAQGHEKETFDLVSLSLIVLGETLSNAKTKIVEQIGFKIRGWHGDAAEGWGTSRLVKDKMKAEWCAKTLHALEGQFCGNTTGLLAAFSLQPFLNQDHKACTTGSCWLTHVEDDYGYEVKHQGSCDQRNCNWVGIEPEALRTIIRKGAIPLLLLKNGPPSVPTAVKLTDTSKCKDYATISHVWSDGYGNPKENKIHRCQLEFLRSAVHSVEKSRNKNKATAFWIDTLAIPVGEDYNEERKIGIGRIHETFVRSRYTIVIDKGLCQNWAGERYHEIAIRILVSGWMRRLWTLQEAYLSDKIFFKFRDDKAFGWAPTTWMSGYAADYPDPLALVTPPTRLVLGEGLHVEFPGITLHSIPGTNPLIEMAKGLSLRFPVDNTLAEWYEVKYADEFEHPTNYAATQQSRSNEYAIILSRWNPGEIEEIALMVEVGQTLYRNEFGSNMETQIINVAIEFRVWIRRFTWREENVSRNHYGNPISMLRGPLWGPQNMGMDTASRSVDGGEEGIHTFGEVLDFNQRWCVGKEHSQRKTDEDFFWTSSSDFQVEGARSQLRKTRIQTIVEMDRAP